MKNTRFLIASGGTGGHFYPGFSVGKALQSQGAEVLFVVRRNDPAAATLRANGLHYYEIDLMGLPRSVNPVRHVRFAIKLVKAFGQTRNLIKSFHPQVTLGMGGYVSFPLIFCSHWMGVKTAVHESNAIWGLSNRICSWFANLRLLGLPMKKIGKNTVLSSTPIRAEFAQPVNRQEVFTQLGLQSNLPTVLVMGGSQGAKGLNEALPGIIKQFTQWQFIHLTGQRWYETQLAAYKGLTNVKTLPYSEEVYKLMKSADLMVCRSGASTLAEVIACQVPAVFVPFPHAAANHQYFNAKVLVDQGCGCIVEEGADFEKRLLSTLKHLTADDMKRMKEAYHTLSVPSPLLATQEIVKLLISL